MAGFFEKFNTTIMDKLTTMGDVYQAQYATGIMSLMVGAVTLYILYVGYSTLGGKLQTPVPDLVWNLARFAMLITFITNAGGYLTALTEGLNGLKAGFTGDTSVWAALDTLWDSTQKLADKIYDKDKSTYVAVSGGLGAALVWGGAIFLMFTSAVVFLTADITMLFMLMTAPIFLFCLMFGFLRPMFNSWLQLIFSSILTVLFASIVIRLAIDFQVEIAGQVATQADDSNLMTMGAMGAVAGLLSGVLVTLAAGFASKLAGAGAEGAMQGLAMAGAMKAAKPVGKAAAKGAGKVAGGIGNGLGGIGNKAASNLNSAPAVNPTAARAKAAVESMKAFSASQSSKIVSK
ncbi:trbL/VirB6 plasmid conjugal transfer family protein (plasmid) [Yersinia pseudotuberculosis IP 32953]|uniref:TriE protein n=1 Tax=Yersinia pseudotuberculosis serotype I (strain IP32953) TaxID=273123 RepID=Q663E3_YERPS|nr:type IV secretion system protein [Yersinia pseudotuberculosis]AJJ53073.1 trbL/VirB6 plasmid conjugal transfer family protein [Yersinia pseudotuberculosis IP 32953]CAF25453.1 TriE protein [Yersinia pseudotuberculosis IP 32953]